ncbi:CHASE2 and HATPase_c domain-containing protein [Limnobacter sp.]|uniref:CHASE2 and HATPase_c domain-containing protein n=1 Tax=Limnobacter sp. TaxID=2003368 RepID=UPI00258F52F9|nr:CHASE2 and HATPase_c domain-containing protein [Limnobacter sp.]
MNDPEKKPALLRPQIILAAWLILFCVLFSFSKAPETLNRLFDDLALSQFHRKVDPQLLLISIDDNSLSQLGQWPWSRALHAQLIDRLSKSEVKAVALDIVLTEPAKAPTEDKALADAISTARMPVFLPAIQADRANLPGLRNGWLTPSETLKSKPGQWVDIGVHVDPDGILRSLKTPQSDAGAMPSLSWAMAHSALPQISPQPAGVWHIPFAGPGGSVPAVSYVDVLKGQVPKSLLAGKLVFVGATAAGLQDLFITPGGGYMPGVEVHAQATDALLKNLHYRHLSTAWSWVLAVLAVLGLLRLFGHSASRQLALGVLMFILAILGVMWIGVAAKGVFIAPAQALFAVLMVYPLWSWQRLEWVSRFASEQLEKLHPDRALGNLFGWSAPRSLHAAEDPLSAKLRTIEALHTLIGESETFFRTILEEHPHPVMIADTHHRLVKLNELARQQFALTEGATLPEFLGSDTWNSLLTAHESQELTLQVQSGQSRIFSAQAFSIASGKNQFTLLLLIDRTEERTLQQQRDDTIRFLSHDLRAPQSSILAMIDDARERTSESYNWPLLDKIAAAARRTLSMAQGFLEAQRAEHNTVNLTEVQINNLALEAIYQASANAKRAGVTLTLEENNALYYVQGDHELLARVLQNLLDNAIKYSPAKGRVWVRLSANHELSPGTVAIEVEDEGPGIPATQREQIFKPFVQGDAPKGDKGIGLGLHFVQQVARQLGGNVACLASPMGGALFRLELPCTDVESL